MPVPASRKRPRALRLPIALFAVFTAQFVAAPTAAALVPTVSQRASDPILRRSEHVLIVSIDGLRPDAIEKYRARTLLRLMREGSYTLRASTIMPSKTLPSHTSMLTGVDVDRHGVTWNSEQLEEHGHVDVPTIFALAKQRGMRTAAFFSKTKFHHLETPNTIDHVRSPKGGIFDSQWLAPKTMGHVTAYLESSAPAPNLMFVHIGEPDFAGHVFGWMSGMYEKAVQQADEAVARLVEEAEARFGRGNFTVIVTADHGGHGRTHGSADPRDTTIPWITWGKGVVPGARMPAGVRTMDTAATALWLLGIAAPPSWQGRALAAAFTVPTDAPATLAGQPRP